MMSLYDTSAGFKQYVDRYCTKHGIDRETAFTHSMIRNAYEYYENAEKKQNKCNKCKSRVGSRKRRRLQMKDIGKKLMDIARWYSMPADHFNTIKEAVELLEKKSSYNSVKTESNGDVISIQALEDLGAECIAKRDENGNLIPLGSIDSLPSVTPQTKMGKCKDCKWWKDSDGLYRRGCRAESKCPINRREVLEGNGYCYMFESQPYKGESEE